MKLPIPPKELEPYLEKARGKFVTLVMMCYDHFEFEFDSCVLEMEQECRKHGIVIYKYRTRCTDVEKGRHDAVRKGFFGDYLFFLDSDQICPADTLVRLMEHDAPIVGTLVTTKYPPHMVVTGLGSQDEGFRPILDWPKNALIEVDATGFGCCLIKREVFEKFPDGNPFLKVYCKGLGDNYGEDWSFCIRAREHGFPIYVDTSIPVGHKGSYIYTIGDYELYRDRVVVCEEGKPYYYACTHPKLIKRLEKHGKMDNILVMGDPSATNGQVTVIKPKPQIISRMDLMGAQY